uniref:AAA+ ATPase domain-containing protein n=1 Tax=Graphocephala atropunctata TaxID=36148 RepID=A0A1B6KGZ2_9HEMI
MKHLSILPQTSSLFNVQKLCISDQVFPATSNGKFAIITSSNKNYYLCKIFFCKLLHPSFCKVDTSVCGLVSSNGNSLYPTPSSLTSINLSEICILPSVENIKSIVVSVVFSHPLDIKKWKHQTAKLSELLKNILKVFFVKGNSVVYINGLKSILEVKIHCLLIENIGNVNVGRVGNSTKIKINKLISNITFEQIYTFRDDTTVLGGLEQPLHALTVLVKAVGGCRANSSLPVCKQVLILGPVGCGKTTLVQQVARDCGLVLRTVVGPELSSPLPGEAEKALTTAFDECRLLAQECPGGCLLLLDQVESLCGRHGDSTESHVVRLTNHLLTLLESVHSTPGLVVVGTTSRPQALHAAARRPGHFDHEIHIGVSNESERVSILRAVTRRLGLCDSLCVQVAQWTPGFVGADLALLASNTARQLERRGLPPDCDDEESLLSCWRTCVSLQQPTALRGQLGIVQGERGDFSQLGGVDSVKLKLLQAVQWPLSHPEAFRRLGLPQPKGVLLYGPPGCAKTSLARAVAGATHTTFLAVSAAQIYSPYVGDAERTVSELFHRARTAAPAILFIDEIVGDSAEPGWCVGRCSGRMSRQERERSTGEDTDDLPHGDGWSGGAVRQCNLSGGRRGCGGGH